MGMQKQLLLTSDDFGMCHSVNLGITQAMTEGICKSTNFLAPTPWFNEAVSLAKEHKLDVGVHLCLTCDWDRLKWAPLTSNPRLRTEDGSLPSLHTGLEALGATDDDLYDELKAQVLLVKKAYGAPSHLDSHMAGGQWSGGIYDRVQKVIARLASEFKLTYTYARDPETKVLRHFRAEDCSSAADWEHAFTILGGWTAPGRYHLFGHAAVDSDELDAICSPEHPSRIWARTVRVQDLKFYLDKTSRTRIEELGFELISVAQLQG